MSISARDALKNFNNYMIKMYGANYVEHWTTEDRKTFEILARRARKAQMAQHNAGREDTSFLRVMMNGKRDPEYASEQAKIEAWNALRDHNGTTGVVGTLSPTSGLYDGVQPRKRRIKGTPAPAAPVAPRIDPEDVDSSNIMQYLLGK